MREMGFVVFPGFQVMGFAVITAFEIANTMLKDSAYSVTLLSEDGGLVRSTAGFCVETRAFGDEVFDTLIVGAAMTVAPSTPGLLAFVRQSVQTSRRVVAPCTGAFILAEAGVLDGRRATTHWHFARELRTQFPKLEVDEDRIFIADGKIWTSAGMTAGIDLAIALIENDHGFEIARSVARKLVMYHRRAGGQSQFSTLLELKPKSDRIQKALEFANQHLHKPLSVEDLASAAGLSPRQFSRAFRSETDLSPAKAVEHMRVEAARLVMERGRYSMDEIARETGFGDRERMRRAFLRTLGQPPQMISRTSRTTETTEAGIGEQAKRGHSGKSNAALRNVSNRRIYDI